MCRPIVRGTHFLGCNHFQKTTTVGNIDCLRPNCIYSDRHIHKDEAGENCKDPGCIQAWEADAQQVIHRSTDRCFYCTQQGKRR